MKQKALIRLPSKKVDDRDDDRKDDGEDYREDGDDDDRKDIQIAGKIKDDGDNKSSH